MHEQSFRRIDLRLQMSVKHQPHTITNAMAIVNGRHYE